MNKQIIFQLGTNNWQRGEEFAPGSGILHEAHHHAFNSQEDTVAYSVYPSTQNMSADSLVEVFMLEHDVPICESVSPVSSYRFHSMDDQEFREYKDKLTSFVENQIERIEKTEGQSITIAIAHHTFLNPLILSEINQKRRERNRPEFKILCFVHGTALKMFAKEMSGEDPDYPRRFLDVMRKSGTFEGGGEISACAMISEEQLSRFSEIFPNYPSDQMHLSVNGYDAEIFRQNKKLFSDRLALLSKWQLPISPIASAPNRIDCAPEYVIAFCGKFADWKRLDCLLSAAKQYEKEYNVATLIMGSGPKDAVEHYHSLAYCEYQLQQTYFLGPLQQTQIAQVNAMADLGVYPSRNEPFGLVFIECMACGTPVIGADSGGPKDFVNSKVGALVPEAEGDSLVGSLVSVVGTALRENWKRSKGDHAAHYAATEFSVAQQCANLLQNVG